MRNIDLDPYEPPEVYVVSDKSHQILKDLAHHHGLQEQEMASSIFDFSLDIYDRVFSLTSGFKLYVVGQDDPVDLTEGEESWADDRDRLDAPMYMGNTSHQKDILAKLIARTGFDLDTLMDNFFRLYEYIAEGISRGGRFVLKNNNGYTDEIALPYPALMEAIRQHLKEENPLSNEQY